VILLNKSTDKLNNDTFKTVKYILCFPDAWSVYTT